MKMMAPWSVETSETSYLATQLNIPENLNLLLVPFYLKNLANPDRNYDI